MMPQSSPLSDAQTQEIIAASLAERRTLELHRIKSESFYTQVIDRVKMAASLATEKLGDLLLSYRKAACSGGFGVHNALHGNNARGWASLVANELLRRGVTEFPTYFGPQQIRTFSR